MKRVLFVVATMLSSVAAADTSSALQLKTVDEVVERNDRAVQACGRSLGHHADTVAVLVTLQIDSDGHVAEASAANRSCESRCLERVAKRMTFPATGMPTRVAFPFLLNPR